MTGLVLIEIEDGGWNYVSGRASARITLDGEFRRFPNASVPWCIVHDLSPGVGVECVVGERYDDEHCEVRDDVVWKVVTGE